MTSRNQIFCMALITALVAVGLAGLFNATTTPEGAYESGIENTTSVKIVSYPGTRVSIPISNLNELQDMNNDLNGSYYLANDIDASATSAWNWNGSAFEGFAPIGNATGYPGSADWKNAFNGTFDGKGHKITGLHIDRPSTDCVVLFAAVKGDGLIGNVSLEKVNISGKKFVGGLAGQSAVSVEMSCTGGCVNGSGQNVGGLIGATWVHVNNTYSTCSVEGTGSYFGGLIGHPFANVSNSYAAGSVAATSQSGGLFAQNYGVITSCYWDMETSGQATSDGGTGKTTAEMMRQATFAGWDFTGVWAIDEGNSYPSLQCEKSTKEPIIVDCNGNGDHTTIQAGVDNASAGDVIDVWEGTYNENVHIPKTLSLIGNGSAETIIDGGGSGDVVRVTAGCVNITGFTVTGGGSAYQNAGIELYCARNCTIRNNNVSSNNYGIFPHQSSHNQIANNGFSDNGIAVLLSYSPNNTIENNTCRDNSGGFSLYYSSDNNIIANNTIDSDRTRGSNIEIYSSSRNIIVNNTLTNTRNGVYFRQSSENNIIQGNIFSNNGNGIELSYSSNNTIINNTFTDNGNGIYLSYSSNNIIINNTFTDNYNGIYLTYSSYNTFINNTFTNNGNGIEQTFSSNDTLTNNAFFDNTGHGIILYETSNVRMIQNRISGSGKYGIKIEISDNSNLSGNVLVRNGIDIEGRALEYWNTHNIDTTNTVNGAPLYYWTNIAGGNVPAGAGQVILANCSGVTVENQTIDGTNAATISLGFSSMNTLSRNDLSKGMYGIYLRDSSRDNNITYNNITSNQYGVYVSSDCTGNEVHNCSIFNNSDHGVYGDASVFVNASYNWWGDDSGPYHATNTEGLGDNVSDNVDFIPWLPIVLPQDQNTAPFINTSDVPYAGEDVLYTVNYEVTDPDTTDNHTWSLETNASWLTINSTTGVLSGTPSNADVGTCWVNISVRDGHGGRAFTNFTVTVRNTNDAPTIITSAVITATEDVFYSVDYEAIDLDPTGDTLTWSLSTNAGWLSINITNGWLNGTPANMDVGACRVNVSVTDGNGGRDWSNFTLTVSSDDADDVITVIVDRNGTDVVALVLEMDGMAGTATVSIGEAKNVALKLGETVKVDFDGDGTDDTKVTLTGFDADGKPILTLKVISTDVKGEGDEEEDNTWLIVGVIIIVIVVAVIVIAVMRKKKPEEEREEPDEFAGKEEEIEEEETLDEEPEEEGISEEEPGEEGTEAGEEVEIEEDMETGEGEEMDEPAGEGDPEVSEESKDIQDEESEGVEETTEEPEEEDEQLGEL